MVQTRPRRSMSTLVTPSGRRTVLGKRTACVLFVMNTDPRSMAHLLLATRRATMCVYTCSIHLRRRQPAEHCEPPSRPVGSSRSKRAIRQTPSLKRRIDTPIRLTSHTRDASQHKPVKVMLKGQLTRVNSSSLLVTRHSPVERAWTAIITSWVPIRRPDEDARRGRLDRRGSLGAPLAERLPHGATKYWAPSKPCRNTITKAIDTYGG